MFRTGGDVTRTTQRIHTRAVNVEPERVKVESFDQNVLGVIALSSGLSVAMVWLAARFNLLERRRETRCPACGVIRRRGACNCPS
jgi:hypothetical protein